MREDDVDDEATADDEAQEATDDSGPSDGYDLETTGLTMEELVAVLI